MRKLTLSLAVLAALLPGRANTLGLGELELNSALNQELDAEIEVLSAAPEDAEQMLIRLASREAFSRAGIDRPYLLQQLKFDIVSRNGKPYIKISTKSPIKEPFLSFLVEIDWPEGHLLREYTVLLDPPVYSSAPATTTPAEMESGGRPFIDPADVQAQPQSASPQQDYARPAESAYMAPAPGASQGRPSLPVTPPVTISSADTGREVTYQPMAQYREVGGSYRVQQDDTLWSLANKLRPDSSISVEQMMLALVRKNPEAFIKENIHGIKRGYILRMPERSAITSIDRQAALAQVREHTALWREYRQALSGAAPASAMEADTSAGAEGISEEPGAGQLSIVAASGDEGSDTAAAGQDPSARELSRLRNELSLAQESLESERLEKENLKTRLAELEQRVKRAIEVGDEGLADLQQELQGAQQAMEEAPSEPVAEAEQEAEPMTGETPAEMPAEESMTEPAEMAEQPAEEAVPEEGEQPVFVDETAPAEETMEQAPVEPAVPAVKPAEVPAFARPEPTSLLDKLFNDPKLLAAAGAGLMAILALIALLLRRLRKGKGDDDEWVADEDLGGFDNADMGEATLSTPAAESIDSTSEMQAAGLDDTQIEAPDDSGEQLEDTVMTLANDEPAPAEEEKDDVLAEADVYLAYGIYQQAEELLSKAIGDHPERDDYRMKLLETHFASKNSDAFAQLAEDVHQRKGSDRHYWDRVQVMGRELCPSHRLFSSDSAESLPGLDTDDLLPKKPETTDLELDAGEDELSADLDLGFDEDTDDHQATQMLSEPLELGESTDSALELPGNDEMDLAADLESFSNEIEDTDELGASTELAGSSEEDEGLEFDLGDFETDMQETEQAASAEESDELDLDEDFSLDFEASDLGFDTEEDEETATETAAVEEPELDADLDLGISLDEPEESAGELELDMDMDMDVGGELDLDADLELAGAETEPSLDMETASSELSSMDDDDFDISELSEDVDEVTTKLDLARAYIDMGDNEGARSILEEVKQEGNEEQQARATELLQQAS